MKQRGSMARRVAILAAGTAMVTSLGLAGVDAASAAAPTAKVTSGATWTLEVTGGSCLSETFNTATHRFTSATTSTKDKGTWSGGGGTIVMTWTRGPNEGLAFKGTWTTTPTKGYEGQVTLNSARDGDGLLVKGVVTCV